MRVMMMVASRTDLRDERRRACHEYGLVSVKRGQWRDARVFQMDLLHFEVQVRLVVIVMVAETRAALRARGKYGRRRAKVGRRRRVERGRGTVRRGESDIR